MLLRSFFLMLFLGWCGCPVVHAQDTLQLAYVKQKGNWKLINASGTVLADSLFEHPDYYNEYAFCNEGWAASEQNFKLGYKHVQTGKRIPCVYDAVRPFMNGIAVVAQNGKEGYINEDGQVLGALSYDLAGPFDSQGNAVAIQGKRLLVLDRKGQLLFSFEGGCVFMDRAPSFSGELLAVKAANGLIGFTDRKGKWVIAPAYDPVTEGDYYRFESGYALVKKKSNTMLIDRQGNPLYILQEPVAGCRNMGGWLYVHSAITQKYGLVNTRGAVILPYVYDYIGPVQGNRILVQTTDTSGQAGNASPLYWYVDTSGIRSVGPFESADTFQSGWAMINGHSWLDKENRVWPLKVQKGRMAEWNNGDAYQYDRIVAVKREQNRTCTCQEIKDYFGYTNRSGQWIIAADYDMADVFSCGLAAVQQTDEGWWYIDKQGRRAFPGTYDAAGSFFRCQVLR